MLKEGASTATIHACSRWRTGPRNSTVERRRRDLWAARGGARGAAAGDAGRAGELGPPAGCSRARRRKGRRRREGGGGRSGGGAREE